MCGRFVQERSITELAELFEAEPIILDDETLATARYNLAPTDPAAVIVERADGRRAVTAFRWGLVPHWSTSPRDGARMINARAETVASLPAYRDSFRRRRCLVPADAFYEWTHPGRPVRAGGAGRAGAQAPAVPDPANRWTAARIRRPVGDLARPEDRGAAAHVLDRDPRRKRGDRATARPDARGRRTRGLGALAHARAVDPAALHAVIDRPPDVDLEIVPVGPSVNNVRNQGPGLIEPLAD